MSFVPGTFEPMEPSAKPWTNGLAVAWRADFTFYEVRIQILRELRGMRLLRRFTVDEQTIRARLTDERELVVTAKGCVLLDALGSDFARGMKDPLRIVASLVDPAWTRITLVSGYVVEIPGTDYKAIRKAAVPRLLGKVGEDLNIFDSAVLADGEGPRPELGFQIEYGIVDAAETPERLMRVRGKVSGPRFSPGSAFLSRDYPDVALFVDCRWDLREEGAGAESLLQTVESLGPEVDELSCEIVRKLHQQVTWNEQVHGDVGSVEVETS